MLLVASTSRSARADGYKIQLQGVKALGLGYSGRAIAEDAAAVWFNPSGMTQLTSPFTVTFGGAWIPFDLNYVDRGSFSVLGQALTGAASRNGGKTTLIPVPHFYGVIKLNDSWRVGLGFNAPYGLSDDYGSEWAGRYHATESTLEVVNLTTTLAYKVNERLSLGGGIDVQHSNATLSNRIDFGSLAVATGVPLVPQGHDGGIVLNASDWAFGFNLSTTLQATGRLRMAATYRSAIVHTLRGTAEFEVPASAAFFRAAGAFTTSGATATLPMPRELSGSAALDLSTDKKWVLVGDYTWTDWSQFKLLQVSFDNPAQPAISQRADYRDSNHGGVGLIFRATGSLTIRGGGLYERTPVPDATRTPRLPEEDNLAVTVGGTYRVNPTWDLDFSLSHLIPHDAEIRLADPVIGTLNGTVGWKTTAIAVGLSHRFDKPWFTKRH
ncbi:MAG: outer membrane protein transport protein [Vicinamibacterales bacterium]